MTRAQALLLRAFSVWTVYVWATRIVNIVGDDHSAGFKIVHSILAVVSIAFAIAAWVVVTRVRRSPGATNVRAQADDVELGTG